MNTSPYQGLDKEEWASVTERVIQEHPLDFGYLVQIILSSWNDIFDIAIGKHSLKIGQHLFPRPQVIGYLLHELIPSELSMYEPSKWRREEAIDDKDIVYIPNDYYSIELKTSSNPSHVFGNRSYAQKSDIHKKSKNGYYLTVNFEKFSKQNKTPRILLIRFGWLDHTDWIAQKSSTGQQARLSPDIYKLKFKTLYQ